MNLPQGMTEELTQIVRISGLGLAFALGACVAYLLFSRSLMTLQNHRYLPEPLVKTFRRIGFWTIALASLLIFLGMLGVLQSVITAIVGVFALLAIGFVAVWSVLSNTLCSLILMIIRPYRVGDTLALPPDDLHGKVVNFNLIFTTLETDEGCLLQVPNNLFFQRPVVRKVGKWRIGLADQLYEAQNATGERKPLGAEQPQSGQAAA